MSGNLSGISGYRKAGELYGSNVAKNNRSQNASKDNKVNSSESVSKDVTVREFTPLSSGSSLIPTAKTGYGTVIGDVELSDKAKEYYDKLKSKFHGMDFILVSNDLKAQVNANASAYGNASRQVVLIDEEKLERMATDEAYRKKYEGIIESSQAKMMSARNSLVAAGAVVKNFGMSVAEDGKTSFFATIQKDAAKSNEALKERQAKKKAENKAQSKKAEAARKEKAAAKKAESKKAESAGAGSHLGQSVDFWG